MLSFFTGGAISISADGKIGVEWNSFRMAWASAELSKKMINDQETEIVINYGCSRNDNFEHIYTCNEV